MEKGDRGTNPGPGNYVVKAEAFPSNKNIIIGKETRGKEDKEQKLIPGPASYKPPKAETIFKSDGNVVFGNATR